jgi:hypothetical protein
MQHRRNPLGAVAAIVLVLAGACSFDGSGRDGSAADEPGDDVGLGTGDDEPGDADVGDDADTDAPSVAICEPPSGPGTCEDGTCVVTCAKDGSCKPKIVCPAGIPCQVTCSGKDSCKAGVECGDASDCDVTCSGEDSCENVIACGTHPCDVQCSGEESCDASVTCADACACAVDCADSACDAQPLCPSGCDSPASDAEGGADGGAAGGEESTEGGVISSLLGCLGTDTCDRCGS